MAASSPFDLMQLDSLFPKESLQLRDQTREMINKDFLPQINENFENEVFPTKAVKSFAEAKLFGPTIQGYGCLGTDHNTYGLLMQEIERCDSGLRSFASVQGALCMYPIYKFGKKPIKDKYLEAMAKGDVIGCFGLTEPEHGSNPSGMTTTATKRGDTWILNGHKRWLTNGLISDLAVIWAKNDDGKVNGFVIPSKTRGMNLKAIPHRWSLRASVSAELELVDVEVDESHRLDIEGLKGPFSCLNLARFGIGWGALGAAQACFEETLCYTKQRSQFANKPLAGHQLIQAKLVEIFTDITTGQLLSFRTGQLLDAGDLAAQAVSMAKMNNVSKSLKAARLCRDMLGANGVTLQYHVGRHLMNLETVNTYEGTEDIHRLILGQFITGENAFL